MLSALNNVMAPVLALVIWTLVMTFWMLATRLPAMKANKLTPNDAKRAKELQEKLPAKAAWVGDNYNHLHEQPVIFYALCVYSRLQGVETGLVIGLAWAYVAVRVVHSFIQATTNHVPYRSMVFALGTLLLIVIAGLNVWQLIAG